MAACHRRRSGTLIPANLRLPSGSRDKVFGKVVSAARGRAVGGMLIGPAHSAKLLRLMTAGAILARADVEPKLGPAGELRAAMERQANAPFARRAIGVAVP
jgi:hypothetical protein